MDPATAQTALRLQLDDISKVLEELNKSNGKSSNEGVAFRTLQKDIQKEIEVLENRTLALRILRSEHDDVNRFQALLQEERQAIEDHQLACRLVSSPVQEEAPKTTSTALILAKDADNTGEENFQNTIYNDLGASIPLFYDYDSKSRGGRGEPSRPRNSTKYKGKAKAVETHIACCACLENKPHFDVLQLACKREENHAYCRECLLDLFASSMTDSTLFPPRCCGNPIPVEAAAVFFTPAFVTRFKEKSIELSTPNPCYCSNQNCAKFINPRNIKSDLATCTNCQTKTCTTCKGPAHLGLCPSDPNVKLLMDEAGRRQWQRCYSCRNMVEMTVGCFHVVCRCGAAFCYLCGVQWKRCKCPFSDANRLLQAAATLDQEELDLAPPPAPAVEQTVQVVQNNDQCLHQAWTREYRKDGHDTNCELCDADHLFFINECSDCALRACNRCMHNRL
ncbi:hypothetical protein AOQ84DRAFT_408943 [Glonium stellatum]|uniref:RBR-type E3 ubiquitin transferase n=1 Tax=Glonium stellatum TaxID=574774 RepID=A0A8E2JS46_9PEZI|nr:hypothetical protein AOQ84DRAFT_408943 [Glonium stellatum]